MTWIVLDFSIFYGPTSAWGQVSGKAEVARKPTSRTDVDVPSLPEELLSFPTEVKAVWDEGGSTYVTFIAFAKNVEAAALVGIWLERELGLVAWPYHDE